MIRGQRGIIDNSLTCRYRVVLGEVPASHWAVGGEPKG
jgi:hypothetical protein